MNPSLEASRRHPWRQALQNGAEDGTGEVFKGTPGKFFEAPNGSILPVLNPKGTCTMFNLRCEADPLA
ncbi:hypothetical protein [Halorhodospira halochloris]|uniref:hypothetical protein n=1 Tax=Halorhodospira halochloris TaxID=1052 RepID=UPI00076F8EC2|nr:hypothetical protein [Halorhodospira halochloris]